MKFSQKSFSLFLEASVQRSSVKKMFLEILQNLQENTSARVYFSKVAGLRPATLLKMTICHKGFPVNFAKFLRTPVYIEHLWLLLLTFSRGLFETRQMKQLNGHKSHEVYKFCLKII